jgi:hypothetical protein
LSETVTLPANGKLIPVDFDKATGNEIASFEGSMDLKGNQFSFSEKVVLTKRVYEAADWDAYKNVVSSQQKFTETPIIIDLKN